jgi:valyl-tRNA synthetase
MGWFSKKEKVPEIPPAPQLPPLPKKQVPEINSPNQINEGFQMPFPPQSQPQSQIPSVPSNTQIQTPEDNEVKVTPPLDGAHFKENKSMIPSPPSPPRQMQKPKIQENEKPRTVELSPSIQPEQHFTKKAEPLFIRLDKFQNAKKEFNQVQIKVKEIEFVLRKIKDVKSKEENEISSWQTEVEKIKSRLAEIESNIFSKI